MLATLRSEDLAVVLEETTIAGSARRFVVWPAMDRWWGPALAAMLAFAACSGGHDGTDTRTARPGGPRNSTTTIASTAAPPSTTTTIAATTATVAADVPPYSFDDSVPPPPLVNTGADYEAIYRSLKAYASWLLAHHPDPELASEIALAGSEYQVGAAEELRHLRVHDLRYYRPSSVIESVETVSELDAPELGRRIVTLRATYRDDRAVVVHRDGSVEAESELPDHWTWTALIASDRSGRWRLVSEDQVDDSVVEL